MADYWKSQPRHFCEFCKCWIADNKPSRDFHEKGKRHKENVERKIKEVREKSEDHWKVQQENKDFLQQMEAAALKAAAKDIASDPSLASQYGINTPIQRPPTVNIDTVSSWAVPGKKVEQKVSQPEGEADSGPWVESTSPEGYTYYYNTVTGETQWELPSSLKTSEEADKSVGSERKAAAKATENTSESEKNADCPWVQGTVEEGHVYYYNTQTGESQWEKPANFTTATKESKSQENRSDEKEEKDQEEEVSTSSSIKKEEENCPWVERTSPEGYTYYSNTVTGESQWEKPSNFTTEKSTEGSSKKVKRKDEKEEQKEEASAEEKVGKGEEEEEGGEKEEKKEKRPLKRKSAYGAWTTVQQTSQKIDLQLPCGAADQKPDPTPQFTEEPVRVKFKEKTVTSLSSGVFSSEEPVGFKKKKVRANRSIRRRDDED